MRPIDRPLRHRQGMTLLELIVCTVIIGVMATTALPLSRHFVAYQKEQALKETLVTLRRAIDRFYDLEYARSATAIDSTPAGLASPAGLPVSHADLFPVSLQELVEKRILRRIPIDPVTGRGDWRTISTSDPETSAWTDGRNVFDVRSLATGTARDGSLFGDW
jgi:general secretion pathway protein G